MEEDYLRVNRENWNSRAETHYTSEFYDVEGFLGGKSPLNSIELELLGNVKDRKLLHLQCHFGQDTIALARLGAQATGVDLSDRAIELAEKLAKKAGSSCRFICSDVYSLSEAHEELYDLVFSSYGTIGWLPDLDRWAGVINRHLKPGGRFVFAEFHPFVWMYDNDFIDVAYSYFKEEPIVETESGSYADKSSGREHRSITWNHSLSEVLQALLAQGLKLETFREFDYSPYNCLNGMEEFEQGKFRIRKFGNKLPLVYALSMVKPG